MILPGIIGIITDAVILAVGYEVFTLLPFAGEMPQKETLALQLTDRQRCDRRSVAITEACQYRREGGLFQFGVLQNVCGE